MITLVVRLLWQHWYHSSLRWVKHILLLMRQRWLTCHDWMPRIARKIRLLLLRVHLLLKWGLVGLHSRLLLSLVHRLRLLLVHGKLGLA